MENKMPRVAKVTSKYVVCFYGSYDSECDDRDMLTADWEGNDVTELSSEINADDPTYPMYFKYNTDGNPNILGWFYSMDDMDGESPDAVMMTTDCFYNG
jgi:hypothetical protein